MIDVALKEGIRFDNLTPRMLLGFIVISKVFEARGVPCVITAGCDGQHMKGSKHYQGDALDIRLPSRYSTAPNIDARLIADLKTALLAPSIFDVVLESDHIHVEYDPKGSVA